MLQVPPQPPHLLNAAGQRLPLKRHPVLKVLEEQLRRMLLLAQHAMPAAFRLQQSLQRMQPPGSLCNFLSTSCSSDRRLTNTKADHAASTILATLKLPAYNVM